MAKALQLTDGTIGLESLGRTLIHEHVLAGMPGWQFDRRAPKFVRAEAMAKAVDGLQKLLDHGCHTIVDPCPMDLGRDVEFVAEVAQKSGVQVVVATGVYTEQEGITYTFRNMPRDQLLELYVAEIEDGIDETGIRAGVIKVASGDPVTDYDRKMLSIAAEASRITGVPIVSHTHLASHGHVQLDVVEAHGGCANCMVVGHSGDRDDVPYQASLAARGAFVGLDRFGLEMVLPDAVRMDNLAQLVREGWRDNLLISQDYALCLQGFLGDMDKIAPNWPLTNVFERIIPGLIERGVDRADIEAILVDNPRRLFHNAAANRRH